VQSLCTAAVVAVRSHSDSREGLVTT
jgi:hypothetical protein